LSYSNQKKLLQIKW